MGEANNILALCAAAGTGALVASLLLLHAALWKMINARRNKGACIAGRAAVRLALRMAQFGQRTLLVEVAGNVRVARAEDAAPGELQYVGALGNLILARQR
jgi:hypothetical protein